MLNPPLSLLSYDLLNYIVDHVAELPFSESDIYNLSITDRAFTRSCQAYIFKELRLGHGHGTIGMIVRNLTKIRNILNDEPSIANRVRAIHLTVADVQNKWLFNDPNFMTIIQLLGKSLMPPHKLHLSGHWYPFTIEDPIFVAGWLRQSFFSQTLTVLNLSHCKNIPLSFFLVCPNLREVYLDDVEVFDSTDVEYPDTQCSGGELPALKSLIYRYSENLVKQMITAPSKFPMTVVDWSKLRVLVVYPQDKNGMMYLQPILDAACNTLEELFLTYDTDLQVLGWGITEQLSLAGLVDIRRLPNLHIFQNYAFIKSDAHEPVVSRDINLILSMIPNANQVNVLSFCFNVYGKHPYDGCLEQDWVGMCDEVVLVSAGKPLELYLEMSIVPPEDRPPGDELYERIKEKIASLSDHPNIRIYFWYP